MNFEESTADNISIINKRNENTEGKKLSLVTKTKQTKVWNSLEKTAKIGLS